MEEIIPRSDQGEPIVGVAPQGTNIWRLEQRQGRWALYFSAPTNIPRRGVA